MNNKINQYWGILFWIVVRNLTLYITYLIQTLK